MDSGVETAMFEEDRNGSIDRTSLMMAAMIQRLQPQMPTKSNGFTRSIVYIDGMGAGTKMDMSNEDTAWFIDLVSL